MFKEYAQYDAVGLAELVARREVAPAELLEAALARAESVNPKINAIVRPLHDRARSRIAGPLAGPFAGVPFLIKDLLADLAGEPTSAASRFLLDYRPAQDYELVRRYERAGLVIFGKTNTPEFGVTPYTEPRLFGPARNPWNLQRTTGGSSGGSAAAVAAGIVPMAHGNDGGGSIRIPASCCGLVGLKPSRGRNPTGPVRGDIWYGWVADHVLTRSVRDCAAALDATAGPDPGAAHFAPPPAEPFLQAIAQPPRRLRIAYSAKPLVGTQMHAECVAGLEATVKLLEELGHELVEAAPPVPREAFIVAFGRIVAGETAADLAAAAGLLGRRPRADELEPATRALVKIGRALSAEEVGLALRTLAQITRDIGRWFEAYDVLLTPTLGRPPFVIGELQPRGLDALKIWLTNHLPLGGLAKSEREVLAFAEKTFDWIPNTAVFNVTGQPSISLPLHWSADGLPVGLMFTARLAEDALLLKLAAALEQARPWKDRRPPL
jgi:amidase